MKKIILLITLFLSLSSLKAQQKLPFYEIPKFEENYTAQTTTARMIAGLGFRFYWATEGLREKDIQYRPTKESNSVKETIVHVYNMSAWILRLTETNFTQPKKVDEMNFQEMRAQTLLNYEALMKRILTVNDIKELALKTTFFQIINGPISDSIWHSGQIVSFRRITGNPINPNISHFTGTVKDK